MADIRLLASDGNDEEREERGRRGHRGPPGANGANGATSPTGATGATGPGLTGPTGTGAGFTVTPATTTRILEQVFTPSPTNNTFCSYTIELGGPTAAGPTGTDIIVELLSDAANPPTTVRATARLNFIGTSGDLIRIRQTLAYIVPLGDNVLLTNSTNVGGGIPVIVAQVEETFTPPP